MYPFSSSSIPLPAISFLFIHILLFKSLCSVSIPESSIATTIVLDSLFFSSSEYALSALIPLTLSFSASKLNQLSGALVNVSPIPSGFIVSLIPIAFKEKK